MYIYIVKFKNFTPGIKILDFKDYRKYKDFPKSENSHESRE